MVGVFLGEHAVRAVAPVGEREVEGRGDVLRGEQLQVRIFSLLVGEGRAPVRQLGERRLDIVLRKRLVRVGIADVRREHRGVRHFLAPEEVVVLRGRTRGAQIRGRDVLLVHRGLVEIAVGGGVESLLRKFVVFLVGSPDQDGTEIHRIRHDKRLHHTRDRGLDAVALLLPDAPDRPLDVVRVRKELRKRVEIGARSGVEIGK